MWQVWRRENLDMILVPASLFIMFGYHLFLLYKYLTNPDTTAMGYENHNKRICLERMFAIDPKDRPASSVLGTSISTASSLSSISLVLSSLIGTWLGSSDKNVFGSSFIYGNTSPSVIAIKYVSLLICFLLAFGAFMQTTRCYAHASYLLTMPTVDIPVGYIEREVIRGCNFYEFGMRALYFSSTLLMWAFGPIPMFFSSVAMVIMLYNLDINTTPLLHYPTAVSQDKSTVATAVKHQELVNIRAIRKAG